MLDKFYFFLFLSCSLKNREDKMYNDPKESLDHSQNFKCIGNKSNKKLIREEINFAKKRFFEEKDIDEEEFQNLEKVCHDCNQGVFGEDLYYAFFYQSENNFSCKECWKDSSDSIKIYCFIHYDSPNEFCEELENNYVDQNQTFDIFQKVNVSIACLITFLSWSKKREINCLESQKKYFNFCIKKITIDLHKFINKKNIEIVEESFESSSITPINKLNEKKYIPVVHDQLYKILEKICKKNYLTLYYISNLSPKYLLPFLKYIQILKIEKIEKIAELDEKLFEEKYNNCDYLEKYKKKYSKIYISILNERVLPYEFYLKNNEKK